MKLNLEGELKEKKLKEQKTIEQSVKASGEVKLLLDTKAVEDQEILKALGPNSNAQFILNQRGRQMDLEALDQRYGKIYTRDQIKEIAIRYRLRFLSSKHFTGNYDVEVLSELKKFSKETGVELNTATIEYKCFVLAPANCFDLKKHTIEYHQTDPVLFWKIDNNHFRMIRKWGSDFTIFRAIQGFRFKSADNLFLFNCITTFPVISLLMGLALSTRFLLDYPIFTLLINLMTTILITAIRYGMTFGDMKEHSQELIFSETNWDEDHIVKHPKLA